MPSTLALVLDRVGPACTGRLINTGAVSQAIASRAASGNVLAAKCCVDVHCQKPCVLLPMLICLSEAAVLQMLASLIAALEEDEQDPVAEADAKAARLPSQALQLRGTLLMHCFCLGHCHCLTSSWLDWLASLMLTACSSCTVMGQRLRCMTRTCQKQFTFQNCGVQVFHCFCLPSPLLDEHMPD